MWLLDTLLRRVVREGELTAIDADGRTYRYGSPAPGREPVTVRFTDRATPRRIARSPSLGAGEGYMDGGLVMERGDIHALLDLFTWNGRFEKRSDARNQRNLRRGPSRVLAWLRTVNRERAARRNVAHHYDLSARLYDLFLDGDRQYSCAYFTDPGESLDQAQLDKKAHIAAKLALAPGQRVLDIGCGWGGMALYLHRVADVDVLGITLSEEQFKLARERAEAAGVAGHCRFERLD